MSPENGPRTVVWAMAKRSGDADPADSRLWRIHDKGPAGESFGLALSWWDKNGGLRGMWCAGENPKGCDLNPGTVLKWDGKQFVFDTEFLSRNKIISWHEVFSDITPTSFIQTADIGEKGGPLKRWLTIHATRVQAK